MSAMLARLRSYVRTLRARGAFEDGMDEEMRFHLESRTADLVRRGLSPADAARRARLEFGSIEKQKDLARASIGVRLLDEFRGDLRYAFRTFVRNKAFAATAVITLALGIGANAAIFNLMDALLLRMLPVYRPQDLVQLTLASPGDKSPSESISYPLVLALDQQRDVFDGVAGFSGDRFTVGTGRSMSMVHGADVTGAFYDTLGLKPALGRLLSRADDVRGAPLVAVASYGYWERAFARDPAIVGRTIVLNGARAEIVGVSPRGFVGANVGATADLTIPVAAVPIVEPRAAGLVGPGNSWLRVLARPRPDVTAAEATARLSAAWPHIAERAISPSWSVTRRNSITQARLAMRPGGTGWTYLRDMYVKPLQVMMGVVALVLLIACANVASLMLARASARRKEIAVRLAIGAGRARIVRQLLVESVTLSLTGAAIGVFLATAAGGLIVGVISTPQRAVVFDLTPNWHIILFTTAVALTTALLFGMAPALQSTSDGPLQAQRDDTRTATPRSRLLPSLVAAQMALSLVLLIGAGLFIRTLRNLHGLDAGFRPEGVLLVGLERRPGSVPLSVLERVRALPGVVSASFSTHTPMSGATWSEPALPAGQRLPERDTAIFVGATPGFFGTLQIPIVAGRDFTDGDARQSPAVAIVNQRYADRYFPAQNPLGHRLSAVVRGEHRELEIVGVARSANTSGLRRPPPPTVYVPYAQLIGDVPTNLELRVEGPVTGLTATLQQMLQPLQPNDPIEVERLSSQVDGTLVQERMMATLGAGFGLLALALACVGVYGLLAYGVARRTKEIGIRMALGARRSRVLTMVLAGAQRPLLAGVALGVPAAWALSRWIQSMLFGLQTYDPVAIGSATLLLTAVAHIAASVPAWRASRVDPLVALRHE
jgi:putative ABC transport system permease protein